MSLCVECREYPAGTRCAAMTCPGKFKVRVPAIADGEGWPFQMLGRVPYRPTDRLDWRDGILRGLGSSADQQAGLYRSFHSQGVAHD